ncbi:MAG: acyl-CoA ligase (AMP-forming), exosortase A system-associated [Undibacterium sp.]|nr:acyl-CoA ligase (AMP-forming), exosortase A system-associated [Undibacterium sp.]
MIDLIHQLISRSAQQSPGAEALSYQAQRISYASLSEQVDQLACGYLELGVARSDRIAVYLEKRPEAVIAMFAASAAGAAFVPINPLLKPDQLAYILADCNVNILVTSADRLRALHKVVPLCSDLRWVILVDTNNKSVVETSVKLVPWEQALNMKTGHMPHRCIDTDIAAILYTSGSTGKPKGVVLSHRNMLAGAASVAQYLNNSSSDRILAVLPLSFDYGFSQLTTAFSVGASVVLMNYLLPQDLLRLLVEEKITGLAAVPPLWIQLSQQKWPAPYALSSLRYITNSGGAMPGTTLAALRAIIPAAQVYLMYGLTEAFRSTYLPPAEVDTRPDSIGKAIPGAELMVINKAGERCAPNEAGELVHRGALVALGYWNDAQKTAERFRPAPSALPGLPLPEIAVWSGDTVRMDAEGYLYFIGRDDDMIKVSGYRVSPLEVEEVVDRFEHVTEQIAVGVPHPVMGQAIVLIVKQNEAESLTAVALRQQCQMQLPAYMVPAHVEIMSESLPRNANGKIDRKLLQTRLMELFQAKA